VNKVVRLIPSRKYRRSKK